MPRKKRAVVKRKRRVGRPRKRRGGGNILKSISKGFRKVARYANKHKIASRALGLYGKTGLYGSSAAKIGAAGVRKLGYGRGGGLRRAGTSRRGGGGNRLYGSGLRTGGGGLRRGGTGLRRGGGSLYRAGSGLRTKRKFP